MLVLGLQGSPRKKGNTSYLLDLVLEEASRRGAETLRIDVCRQNIRPCMGCTNCERKGVCAIEDDDMNPLLYPLMRRADLIILATPIYFYNATSQLKKVIDRSQTLWSRKYKLNLADPGRASRKGLMLAVGATRGKNLFEGMALTAKYFFDAAGAAFSDRLTYRQVENIGDMEAHNTVREDVITTLNGMADFFRRKRILFVCRENACRSQMAAAFARQMAGNALDVACAGSQPAEAANPVMQAVMEEIGFDMAFRPPRALHEALAKETPHMIVTMGCGEECPFVPDVEMIDWELPDPSGQTEDFMRRVRDEIQARVEALVSRIASRDSRLS